MKRRADRISLIQEHGTGGAPVLLTVAGVLSALTLLPLVALVFSAFAGSKGAGSNLVQTVLPGYVANTVFLVFCVGLGTLVIGVATAWLVAMCRFPGRALFSWLLVLPLAMPGYVCAYAYTYLLQHPGPVQSMLREVMDWGPRDY
ncbi:MAG: iron ABC transporter permease, partial [Pseudomonadota bacterium]